MRTSIHMRRGSTATTTTAAAPMTRRRRAILIVTHLASIWLGMQLSAIGMMWNARPDGGDNAILMNYMDHDHKLQHGAASLFHTPGGRKLAEQDDSDYLPPAHDRKKKGMGHNNNKARRVVLEGGGNSQHVAAGDTSGTNAQHDVVGMDLDTGGEEESTAGADYAYEYTHEHAYRPTEHDISALEISAVLEDGSLLMDAKTQERMAAYEKQYHSNKVHDYVEIYEDHLMQGAQEVAACAVGTKLYLIGGYNETRWADWSKVDPKSVILGTEWLQIYDMVDRSVTLGPSLPFRVNHASCAADKKGVLHLMGGYKQDARPRTEAAHKRHFTWDSNDLNATWVQKASMPLARGGLGCAFLRDGKMYCAGGGKHTMGPFKTDLMIYDGTNDTWSLGPQMHTPRDHIMLVPLRNKTAFYLVGGKSSFVNYGQKRDPYFWTPASSAEMFDSTTNSWHVLKGPPTSREATALAPYYRRGPNAEPTVLLVGGQRFYGQSGHAIRTFGEFDPITGLYYCHEDLPFPNYGTAIGVHEGKLHIAGGGEWMGISAQRRVVVVDLKKAPPPRHCFYEEKAIFDQWNRTWNEVAPFPDIIKTKRIFYKAMARLMEFLMSYS